MAYTKLLYHIVFRPFKSKPAITEVYERDLYHYIWGFCKNHDCYLYRINGMRDHIHLLVGLPTTISVASFVHDLKVAAGNYMRVNSNKFPLFESWERSYAAFSCSEKEKDGISQYINRQKEHHKKVSFHDELKAFLKDYGIEYDEKYI